MQHLLHAGATLGSLVANDDDVTLADLLVENFLDSLFLRVAHDGRARELPDRFVNAGGLHDRTVDGDVAAQHGEAAVFRVGVLDVVNATARDVGVEGLPALRLRERGRRANAAWSGVPEVDGFF